MFAAGRRTIQTLRMSSGMYRHVVLVRTQVLEEHIVFTLKMEAIFSSETSVFTRATW
jgi:hypothetical protein